MVPKTYVARIVLLMAVLAPASAQTNQCETDNGGCEHNCHNTDLSYYCTCNSGYRIMEDLHNCLWLNCDDPGPLQYGSVLDTDEWNTESFAEYACDDQVLHVLVGNEHRRCNDFGEWVEWSGALPVCYDECMLGMLERICAPAGGDPDECRQLGCCYNSGNTYCFHKEVPTFIQYSGIRPTENDGNGFDQIEYGTVSGCKTGCAQPGGIECKSYGMHYKGFEEQPEEVLIEEKDCHYWDKSKADYDSAGNMGEDADYVFYDMVPSSTENPNRDTRNVNIDYHNVDILYEGCFNDDASNRDFEYKVWESDRATVSRCLKVCRDWSFMYAGLQNGNECWCSNSVYRIHEEADETHCSLPCSGDVNQICGGTLVNSVYFIPFDVRYIGCYNEESFPVMKWDNDTENSAVDCIEACLLDDYRYAAVYNGGACYCKDSFGEGGEASHEECGLPCGILWAEQDCGGEEHFTFYNTRFSRDMMSTGMPADVSTLYLEDQEADGIPAKIFSPYEKLKSVVSQRITLYASQIVDPPVNDMNCYGDCYEACGAIYHPEGLSNRGEDVYLRFFHINLVDIEQYTGDYAQRVFVFAQTVIIDRDVHFPFSISIRARQIIVDNSVDIWITTDKTKPILFPSGVDEVIQFGPASDLTFMKQSFMCARILLNTRDPDDANAAWAILHDLGHGHAYSEEHEAYLEGVRMFSAMASGIYRSGANVVPVYTKSYISLLLETYGENIADYKEEYDAIQGGIEDKEEFIDFVETMLSIHLITDVWEAQRSFAAAVSAVNRANATYYHMYDLYGVSRSALETVTTDYEECIIRELEQAFANAMKNFLRGCISLVFGRRRLQTFKQMVEDLKQFIAGLQMLAESMEKLAALMEQVERLMGWIDDMLDRLDAILEDIRYAAYMGDIELTAKIYESLVHWDNMKVNTHIIMADDSLKIICGAEATVWYITMIETCNWGEALSRSMLELADTLREAVGQKMSLEAKLRQVERYEAYLQSLRDNLIEQELMLTYMLELEYDIRTDMNNLLFTYCQAFYYEHISPCNPLYAPDFGGSLDDVLEKIELALRDDIWVGPPPLPQPVNHKIQITDDPAICSDCSGFDGANCSDASLCPIKHLQSHRMFVYDFPMGVWNDFGGLDKYRVEEIVLVFHGAEATGSNQNLRIRIEASGPFNDQYDREEYSFISTAVRTVFDYAIDTCDEHDNCHININARPADPYGDVTQRITPYTKWVFTIMDEYSSDIDVSEVTSVVIRLPGQACTVTAGEPDN